MTMAVDTAAAAGNGAASVHSKHAGHAQPAANKVAKSPKSTLGAATTLNFKKRVANKRHDGNPAPAGSQASGLETHTRASRGDDI